MEALGKTGLMGSMHFINGKATTTEKLDAYRKFSKVARKQEHVERTKVFSALSGAFGAYTALSILEANMNDTKTAAAAGVGIAAVGSVLSYTGSKIAQKRRLKIDKNTIDTVERRYKRGEIDDID